MCCKISLIKNVFEEVNLYFSLLPLARETMNFYAKILLVASDFYDRGNNFPMLIEREFVAAKEILSH